MDRRNKEDKKAYKPRQPFSSVEGIGTLAWRKLDLRSIGVLMKFYEKFNGYNRYNLSLTYKEVKPLLSSLLFSRSLWQCIGFGFVDVIRFGRLERQCSLFGLSNRWKRLCKEPEKLEKIDMLLKRIDYLKRQPGSQKKRMEIWELRNKIIKM